MNEQIKLPYSEIPADKIANRDTKREKYDRGVETYWIDFKYLSEREGFNPRFVYNGIEELADKIMVNGVTPLTVDAMRTGKAFIEKGHRRFRALQILAERGALRILDLPGVKFGQVLCFVNDKSVTELDRIKNAMSDNDAEPLSPVEQADCIWRMKFIFKLETKQIMEETGLSRQHIDNRLSLAEQSPFVKKCIEQGLVNATTVTKLARVVKSPDKVTEVIEGMTKSNKQLRGIDVDEMRRTEEKEQDKPETFDENRDEIKWCQNVIRNVDKINSIVSKVENEQMKKDLDQLVGWIQKDMVEIREYVKKHKRK